MTSSWFFLSTLISECLVLCFIIAQTGVIIIIIVAIIIIIIIIIITAVQETEKHAIRYNAIAAGHSIPCMIVLVQYPVGRSTPSHTQNVHHSSAFIIRRKRTEATHRLSAVRCSLFPCGSQQIFDLRVYFSVVSLMQKLYLYRGADKSLARP